MTDEQRTPVAELTYEQARDELTAIVAKIEAGQTPLEEAMVLWQRGEELAAHCQAKLDQAQEQLDTATHEAAAEESAPEESS